MLVKDVFIELRARLRSCNVFITTGVKLNENCNLKINIQSDCITLNCYNNVYDRRGSLSSIESLSDCCSEDEYSDSASIAVDEFCQLIPNSMSCLKIDRGTISFRILTRPKGGDFYAEFVSPGTSELPKSNEPKVNLEPGQDTVFSCANCSNELSKGRVRFDRALELPTTSLDASDWFCHGHGHGATCDLAPKPRSADFLYRLTHFVVNATALSPKTNSFNSKRHVYHCNRCLAWLGVKGRDGVKLFNSEVTMQHNDRQGRVFTHGTPTIDTDTTVEDFIYTIERLTRESIMGLQYSVMCRIVLECQFKSDSKEYLLVWVMDRQLQVLRKKESSDDNISLKSSLLTKILYRVEGSLNEEVESWLADPTVVSTDISKTMFCRGLEHLRSTSQKVPESFRNANGYSVSYLKV